MHVFTLSLLLAASASFGATQDATITAPASLIMRRSSAGCEDPTVVDHCVTAMKAYLAKCSDSDWDCKCSGAANIANCYVNCEGNSDATSARSLSAGNCATANAYDKGVTDVPPVQVTPSNNAAELAASTGVPKGSSPGEQLASGVNPTHATTTADAKESAKPSKGAAGKVTVGGSWLAAIGLGLGTLV
ncbi:hypothetical protein N7468_003574 [Penicillium chermesinum]|uniref:GPI anchored serine-threonine rich protein n=1 Tax=Penicillium chermesinum TaxID=63820 RepID=A0A9W9P6V1_9EURO|nr:uncharacterized protein N7468_003574 [Penicillium chermesinum]KAJ5238955.1 hypothetical protein N7468_003574 [Penicillium chermesinum]KAJ6164598.1 hypothetical protein N7470_003270 [Penicillium chermesinum]